MAENHKTSEKEKTGLIFSSPDLEGISLRGAPAAGQRGGRGWPQAGAGAGGALTGQEPLLGAGARVTALFPKLLCRESKSCRR